MSLAVYYSQKKKKKVYSSLSFLSLKKKKKKFSPSFSLSLPLWSSLFFRFGFVGIRTSLYLNIINGQPIIGQETSYTLLLRQQHKWHRSRRWFVGFVVWVASCQWCGFMGWFIGVGVGLWWVAEIGLVVVVVVPWWLWVEGRNREEEDRVTEKKRGMGLVAWRTIGGGGIIKDHNGTWVASFAKLLALPLVLRPSYEHFKMGS